MHLRQYDTVKSGSRRLNDSMSISKSVLRGVTDAGTR